MPGGRQARHRGQASALQVASVAGLGLGQGVVMVLVTRHGSLRGGLMLHPPCAFASRNRASAGSSRKTFHYLCSACAIESIRRRESTRGEAQRGAFANTTVSQARGLVRRAAQRGGDLIIRTQPC